MTFVLFDKIRQITYIATLNTIIESIFNMVGLIVEILPCNVINKL